VDDLIDSKVFDKSVPAWFWIATADSASAKPVNICSLLYKRLNSFILNIPPLRQRPEDVAGLVRFYLNQYNRK
jgi:DNA-binding NtrC family response regulator